MFRGAIQNMLVAGALLFGLSVAFAAQDVRQPPLDKEGRFWIYRNGKAEPLLLFLPYAWMPAEAGNMMTMDLECQQNPFRASPGEPSPKEMCVAVKVTWAAPYWVGCAWLSGSDAPPWWGDDDRGWYYDLRGLKHKRLVFHARGETGKERIQVKLGILGDKKFGDSLPFPAEMQWLKLGTSWARYELPLTSFKPEQLARICNGFTFVLSQVQQEDPSAKETRFFLDSIYLE